MTTSFTPGQRVNVSIIIKENWQSQHSLYNGIVTRVEGEGRMTRVIVRRDEKSTHSGAGCYNPIASGGSFFLTAYEITPVI